MRSLLFKILILIISCSFSISAIEIDIGSSQQTFFDDYDTYLPVDQQDLQVNEGQVFLQKVGLTLDTFFIDPGYPPSFEASYSYSYSNYHQFHLGKRKIFLYNSSLLI